MSNLLLYRSLKNVFFFKMVFQSISASNSYFVMGRSPVLYDILKRLFVLYIMRHSVLLP